MASITIRNLDDKVKEQLRLAAAHNGRSMEQEAGLILGRTGAGERCGGLGSRIRNGFGALRALSCRCLRAATRHTRNFNFPGLEVIDPWNA